MASRVPSRSGIPRNASSSSHAPPGRTASQSSSLAGPANSYSNNSNNNINNTTSSSTANSNSSRPPHTAQSISSSTGALRRNIFPRRQPTTANTTTTSISNSTAAAGTSTITSAMPLHAPRNHLPRATSSSSSRVDRHHLGNDITDTEVDEEIIIRDPITGAFALENPSLPALPRPQDEADEEAEACRRLIDIWRKNGGSTTAGAMGMSSSSGGGNTGGAGGANVVVEESEIRAVLLSRMEANFKTLEEDGWMFGDEEKDEE